MNSKWIFLGIAALGGVILLSRKAEAKPTPSIYPSIYFGVYTGTGSGIPLPGVELEQFEYDAGKKASIVGYVAWWYDKFAWGDFDTLHKEWTNTTRDHGAVPLILWQPFNPVRLDGTIVLNTDSDYNTHLKKYSLKRIIAGDFDTYIRIWAQQIKVWDHPIMLRPMHELNADVTLVDGAYGQSWYASLKDIDGSIINEPIDAINAWRHIVNIFREEGTYNVTWVWSVLTWPSYSYGGSNSVSLSSIYPGDDYVDWIGVSYYHKDFMPSPEACNDINIQGIYQEMSSLSSIKPMMIAEMGAKEDPSNTNTKPEWIRNTLSFDRSQSVPFKYPRIKAIFYWNDGRDDLKTWIESSIEATNAFKEVIANYHYGTNDYFDLNISPILPPSG